MMHVKPEESQPCSRSGSRSRTGVSGISRIWEMQALEGEPSTDTLRSQVDIYSGMTEATQRNPLGSPWNLESTALPDSDQWL